ncbi:MAG: hypothetical protein IJ113_08845, partial [Eggerthellaceae bacterium]|nr:hypothetical protein [Eggerthellaceae bacterium]
SSGDYLIFSPRQGLFFYGLVRDANICPLDGDGYAGLNHVLLFRKATTNPSFASLKEAMMSGLLVDPLLVECECWEEGFFSKAIYGEPCEVEKEYDIGFWGLWFFEDSVAPVKGIFSVLGEPIDHVPQYIANRCITSSYGISFAIEKEFILDPGLLEVDGRSFPAWGTKGFYATKEKYNDEKPLHNQVSPLVWVDSGDEYSIYLSCNDFPCKDSECNGYYIEQVAMSFLEKHAQGLGDQIIFDSEADVFCATSRQKKALECFAKDFSAFLAGQACGSNKKANR